MTFGMITKYLNSDYQVYISFTGYRGEGFQVLREAGRAR